MSKYAQNHEYIYAEMSLQNDDHFLQTWIYPTPNDAMNITYIAPQLKS